MTGIDKRRRAVRIEDMMDFIRKWWLLEHLREQILVVHSTIEEEVLLTQDFFIKGNEQHPEYLGLVCRAPNLFSIFGWGRKMERVRDIEEIKNTPDFKKRLRKYNHLYNVCQKEDYIQMVDAYKEIGIVDGVKQVVKVKMPSVATREADEISGIMGLLQALLKRYWLAWSVIVFPFLAGLWGSSYWDNFIDFILGVK